jgi:hypothetical protein
MSHVLHNGTVQVKRTSRGHPDMKMGTYHEAMELSQVSIMVYVFCETIEEERKSE